VDEETPTETDPPSAEEQRIAARLSSEDWKVIDAALMAECSNRWLKVARVVCRTVDALAKRYPGLSFPFYNARLRQGERTT
jgi:hypothetical protein